MTTDSNEFKFVPGAHIFGVSLEQDLALVAGVWGAKRRKEMIRLILEDYKLRGKL